MKRTVLVFSFLLIGALANAQNGLYTLDHTDGLWNTDTLNINQAITFHIRANNNSGIAITGQTNGFRLYSDDGVVWDTTISAQTGAITPGMFEQTFINDFSVDGIGADTVGFAGFLIFATGIPDGFNEIVYTLETGPIDASHHQGTLCLDTAWYPPAGTWKWSTSSGDFFPDWSGPHCFTVFDPSAPTEANLILTPDSLHFTGVEGGTGPPAQSFQIGSDGPNLNFTLNENTDWIIPTPIVGTTTETINVSVNTIGLTAGAYIDTILVESGSATNSPQSVVITLDLQEPPPSISATPTALFFNAIAGGANPADKQFTIDNVGGGTLNWTVSESETWLSLAPAAGVDLGVVTVSVDITGLPFNDYNATIFVSDPAADNDPQEVSVSLSVGSDLPIIEADTQVNLVIVPDGVSSIPAETIQIINGGAGAMSFWLQESSARILTLTPDTGTAPTSIDVDFKVSAGTSPNEYFDTIWVFSNEAINSPYPVVMHIRYVAQAAEIVVTQDTVKLNLFECSQGAFGTMPSSGFQVANIGGDDPVNIELLYESDLFQVDADQGVAPILFTVTAEDLGLPLGFYLDTIIIHAPKALNSPDTVFVSYRVNAGLQQPEIFLSKNRYILETQENAGPTPPAVLSIDNRFGGCMPWEIIDSVPWLYPANTTGDVPGGTSLSANSAGFPFGEYEDTLWIIAPDAGNTPQHVSVRLRVWRFHGDWNYDAHVNIADLTAMVGYLFGFGFPPVPERIVGSVNCDHNINIDDVTYLVAYLFLGGPIPCGNPY